MEQEIKDIIAKNLPQHVGEVLKEKLEQADRDAVEIKRLYSLLEKKEESIAKLEKQNHEFSLRLSQENALKDREQKLEDRERNLEIEMLNLKLAESEKRNDIGNRLVETVFRSPVYRKQVENMVFSSYDNQGRYNTTGAAPVNITEITD
jgi:HD-GYP domain-containing protein (c-di-GMP phosphodiesterase class II)